MQLGPVLLREGHIGEHVRLGIIEDGGELRDVGPDLVGDGAPLNAGGLRRLLSKCCRDEGGDDATTALSSMGQHVPHEVDPAALPCG